MVSGCGAADEADVQLELRSPEPLDFIATCISQDWDGVFPRFFQPMLLMNAKSSAVTMAPLCRSLQKATAEPSRFVHQHLCQPSRSLTHANAPPFLGADFVHAA